MNLLEAIRTLPGAGQMLFWVLLVVGLGAMVELIRDKLIQQDPTDEVQVNGLTIADEDEKLKWVKSLSEEEKTIYALNFALMWLNQDDELSDSVRHGLMMGIDHFFGHMTAEELAAVDLKDKNLFGEVFTAYCYEKGLEDQDHA